MKENEYKRWLKQAICDLEDAKFNFSGKRYNIACFLSQQSAEKAFKAYLIYKNVEDIWGHSVSELCNDAKNFDNSFSQIEKESASIDKYYIPTRYPNSLPGTIPSEAFDEEDAKKAINMAEKILNFIRRKIEE